MANISTGGRGRGTCLHTMERGKPGKSAVQCTSGLRRNVSVGLYGGCIAGILVAWGMCGLNSHSTRTTSDIASQVSSSSHPESALKIDASLTIQPRNRPHGAPDIVYAFDKSLKAQEIPDVKSYSSKLYPLRDYICVGDWWIT